MVKGNLQRSVFTYQSKNYFNAMELSKIVSQLPYSVFVFLLQQFICSRLPYWVQAMIPKVFYITEKAWNYYPYTISGKRKKWILPCFCCFVTCVLFVLHNPHTEFCVNLSLLMSLYDSLSPSVGLWTDVSSCLTSPSRIYCECSSKIFFLFLLHSYFAEPCYQIVFLLFIQCSFIPKLHIQVTTRYEDNNGATHNVSYYLRNSVLLCLLLVSYLPF